MRSGYPEGKPEHSAFSNHPSEKPATLSALAIPIGIAVEGLHSDSLALHMQI